MFEASSASKELDEQLQAWRSRPLSAFPYVYLDAGYEKVRTGGVVVSSALLLTIGVNEITERRLLYRMLGRMTGEVPAGDFRTPFDKARIVNQGTGCTIVAYGMALYTAMEALKVREANRENDSEY